MEAILCTKLEALPGIVHFPKLTEKAVVLSSGLGRRSSTPGFSRFDINGSNYPFLNFKRSIQKRLPRSSYSASSTNVGTFRSGQKRPEVEVPSLIIRLTCDEVLQGTSEFIRLVDASVAGGATIIQLDTGESDPGGARLFEAACVLKALLRGRAQLLIGERADIAAASGADGVILSDQGLPAVVARKMMQGASNGENGVLPLVARSVKSQDSAMAATAAEGADLLVLESGKWDVSQLASTVTVPVVLEINAKSVPRGSENLEPLQQGLSGLCFSAYEMRQVLGPVVESGKRYTEQLLLSMRQSMATEESDRAVVVGGAKDGDVLTSLQDYARGITLLEKEARVLTEKERLLLQDLLSLLEEGSPEMPEMSLLRDALAHLDDLFLIVIVGEFNSGKSSVVNALLGDKYVREGVIPTTNEISLLRHSEGQRQERAERHPDGHFVRFLPSALLQKMNLVDTPGTNVILERQQRLTEEFVPRADLVFFVLSADRPLTESEVSFLRYIREWGKKVVFLLNKADLLSNSELDQVMQFVQSNAKRLLSVDSAQCFPVSARKAMAAKLARRGATAAQLAEDREWQASRFGALEAFIAGFLDVSSESGAERVRLKLDTPLGVSAALLGSAQRQLALEAESAAGELGVLDGMLAQAQAALVGMREEGDRWTERVRQRVDAAVETAEALVDSVLTVSSDSAQTLLQYALSGTAASANLPAGSRLRQQVLSSAADDVKSCVFEFRAWLASNSAQLILSQTTQAASSWPEVQVSHVGHAASPLSLAEVQAQAQTVEALQEFDAKAAALLLDEEIRVVAVELLTGFGAAGTSASVLTAVLPTSIEDLLALALCSLGGYSFVLKLPEKRSLVKSKVRRVAQGVADRLVEGLEEELERSLEEAQGRLEAVLQPYVASLQMEAGRVRGLQARATLIQQSLKALRAEVQNLGC